MKNPNKCAYCHAIIPRNWREAGAWRLQLTYSDNSKSTEFTCIACRAKKGRDYRNAEPPKEAA